MVESETDQTGERRLIAYHLRYGKEGCLERCRATGDESSGGMGEQGVGFVLHQQRVRLAKKLLVILNGDGWRTGDHRLIVRKPTGHLKHRGQIVFNFLQSATGKQGDDGPAGIPFVPATEALERFFVVGKEASNLVCRGIPYVMDGIMMPIFEKRHFERQDGKELIDIAFNAFDAVFFPRPDLWRYVIIDGNASVGPKKLGDVEVETGLIDEYHHVGLPVDDVAFAHRHVLKDGSQVQQHRDKAHVGHLFEVPNACSADSRHEVAAQKSKLGLWVFALQGLHKM